MKNKLLSLGLVAGFSIVALTSCNDFLKKGKDQAILTIGNEDYTTSDLMEKFESSNSTGIEAYYNAISEVLIRNATKTYAASDELSQKVKKDIESLKEEAKDNASAAGTSYKEELDSLLKTKGVDDLDELKEQYIYNYLKEKLQDDFYDEKTVDLRNDYIDEVIPYHIRHLLVNVSATAGSIYDGQISSTEALKLAAVVRRIGNIKKDGSVASSTTYATFGQIAKEESDDSTSAENYGDVGIMTTKTSFVNEFKLGIYAYESLYCANVDANSASWASRVNLFTDATSKDADNENLQQNTYAIPTAYAEAWSSRSETIDVPTSSGSTTETVRRNNGIGYIPYSATQLLDDYAEITTDIKGNTIKTGKEAYLPRNIVFNQYFNDHGINVITNDVEVGNFKKIPGYFDGKAVLCADGDTNKVVLVTRAGSSYQGVHFMVIEKSGITSSKSELSQYYDDRTGAELTKDGLSDLVGNTYVTFVSSSSSQPQKKRSTTVIDEIKGFDSMLDARIFNYYLNDYDPEDSTFQKVTIVDEKLKASIEKYINDSKVSTKLTAIESNISSWQTYIYQLQVQDLYKDSRVKLSCSSVNTDSAEFTTAGGVCYHE